MQVVKVSRFIRRMRRLVRARSSLLTAIILIGTMLVTSIGVPGAPALAAEPTSTPAVLGTPQIILAPEAGSSQQPQLPEQPAPQTRTVVPTAPVIPAAIAAKISTSVQVEPPSGPVEPGSFGVGHVAYSSDGSAIALGTAFGIYLYDAQTRQPAGRIDTGGAVSSIAFSPNGTLLAAGSFSNDVQLWQANGSELVRTLQAPAGQVNWVAFSPDGTLLAVASSDALIRIWNVADGTLIQTLAGHSGPVGSVAFSPDGKSVASGASDGSVHIWSVEGGISTNSVVGAEGGVTRVVFSADGSTVAFSSGDGVVRLWQINGGQVPTTLTGHLGAITDLTFNPGGALLASASTDGTVRLWQIADGKLLTVLPGNIGALSSIAFRPDGRQLIAFSYGGAFRLWSLAALFPTEACTDGAAFVVDVTVPNNTIVAPGAPFQKVWRVQNVGTCTWSDRYKLVFASGAQMSDTNAQPLTVVAPGNTLDIAINMVAPAQPGPYQAVWQTVDPNGNPFGPGLTVLIQSGTPGPVVYITASATNINAGDSVTIQATAQGTVQAWLDGELITNGVAQKTVQLCGTTTFTVDGMLPDGSHITQSVTVTVNGSCGGNEADLRIKELNASDTNPTVGEVVHFSARVKNEGDQSSDDFDLEWRPSSGSSYSVKGHDLNLDPGDDEWVDWNYTFNSTGTFETRARVEDNDHVTHRSLTIVVSGSATPTPTPTGADVVMTDLTADDTTPQAGQVVQLTATLHNQGSGSANNFRLVWRPSDATGYQLASNSVSLNAGETQTFDFAYTYSQAGTYNVTSVVTSGGQPVLTGSNFKTLLITVSSAFPTPTPGTPTATPTVGPAPSGNPALVVTGLTADPSAPAAEATVTFRVTVQNQGDGPANGFQVLWRPGTSSAFQFQIGGLNLDAGQSLQVQFDYAFAAEGTYETEAVAEFASVRGLALSAAPAGNSRTLTVVVGPVGSSLKKLVGTTTPTATPTIAGPVEPSATPIIVGPVEPTATPTIAGPTEPTATPTAEVPVVTEPTATPTVEAPIVTEPTATPTVAAPVVTEPTATPTVEAPIVTEPTATPTVAAPVVAEPTATPTVAAPPPEKPLQKQPAPTATTAPVKDNPVVSEPAPTPTATPATMLGSKSPKTVIVIKSAAPTATPKTSAARSTPKPTAPPEVKQFTVKPTATPIPTVIVPTKNRQDSVVVNAPAPAPKHKPSAAPKPAAAPAPNPDTPTPVMTIIIVPHRGAGPGSQGSEGGE
jgi:WD40 repeat protein